MSIFVTGDTHGNWLRFSKESFYEQKDMTRNDFVIQLGDFGIWNDSKSERYHLNWLQNMPFTICFVDGNHENFDRLEGGEFPEVDFHGGRAHKIRDNIYHLERGYVYELQGKKFFAFGGASSHDIQDGIIDRKDYKSELEFRNAILKAGDMRLMCRVNHVSWWARENPSEEEYQRGLNSLDRYNWDVDYVITHCPPSSVSSMIIGAHSPDKEEQYFEQLLYKELKFNYWLFGHMHVNRNFPPNFVGLYEQIVRIL